MSYENRLLPKEVGREHSLVAERRREAKVQWAEQLRQERAMLAEQGAIVERAAAPVKAKIAKQAREEKALKASAKPSGVSWKPSWMK